MNEKKITKKFFIIFLLSFTLVVPPRIDANATSPTPVPINDLQDQIDELKSIVEYLWNNSNSAAPTSPPQPIYDPIVKLISPLSVSIKPGETIEVDLNLKNIGISSALNLLVLANADSPLTAQFVRGAGSVGILNENSTRSAKMQITASEDISADTYAIKLEYYYKDGNNKNISGSDTLNVRVNTAAVKTPRVSLLGFKSSIASVAPGGSFTVTAVLENLGDGTASDVQVSLEGLDSAFLYLTSDLNAAYIRTAASGFKNELSFAFTAAQDARAGTYPLTFVVSYSDSSGKDLSSKHTYFVSVASPAVSEERAVLAFTDITVPSTTNVGGRASVTMIVTNVGRVAAKNVELTAQSEESLLAPITANKMIIGRLAPGESQTVRFTFMPTSDAATRTYMVTLSAKYATGINDNEDSFHQYAGVFVNNPEKNAEASPTQSIGIPKPKMIISEYSCDPGIVRAGREFDLNFTFQNASAVREVTNLKITLTTRDVNDRGQSVFAPVGASNTFYIDSIKPKAQIQKTLTMFTIPNAEQRSYTIDVAFEYQDETFTATHMETEVISINVRQVTRIETNEFWIPDSVPAGQMVYIQFSIINSGRVSLNNLRVRVDGEFDTSNSDIYVGNLGRGNSQYYEGYFIPNEPGEWEGSVVVYGEDDTGEIVECVRPFTLYVYEMTYDYNDPYGGGYPGMEKPVWDDGDRFGDEGGSFFQKAWIFIKKPYVWGPVAGLVVAATVIVTILLRKRQRVDFDE